MTAGSAWCPPTVSGKPARDTGPTLRRARRCARRAFLEVRPSNAAALALYLSENFSEVSLRKDYYPTPTGREDALVLAKLL